MPRVVPGRYRMTDRCNRDAEPLHVKTSAAHPFFRKAIAAGTSVHVPINERMNSATDYDRKTLY